jgi:catechol 2,3-dioxygenase-like lactoylglutathione lyase family enzyme
MPHDRFNRREALAMLGALAAKRATGQTLKTSGLDHVAIAVPDAARSVAFYSRIFGADVLKDNNGPRRYFRIGKAYIAIAPPGQGQEPGRVDHICAGIGGFESAKLKSDLDQLGIPSREVAVGLYVTDPDGIQVQLWTQNSWSQLGRTAAAEAVGAKEEPAFRPAGLDHILLRVSDMEKSAAFYQKLFGPVAQRGDNPPRIWFQVGNGRLGLAPAGPGPGVDHFCVAVANFDLATAIKALKDRGASMQAGESDAAPLFRDPDGILVQVTRSRSTG